MSCVEVQSQAGAYLDGELGRAVHSEIERHLVQCAACSRAYARETALHRLLKEHAPDFQGSPQLRARIEAGLALSPPDRRPFRLPIIRLPSWWRFATALMLGAVIGWSLNVVQRASDDVDDLKDAAVAVHRRSLQETHLVDVAATEPARLEQWFKARLPYAPPIQDLSGDGYALVGGRLDYLYQQPLAAVVYRRHDKLVNLLVWPASQTDRFPTAMLADERLNVQFWKRGSNNYCAISDLSQDDFAGFVKLARGV